MVKLRRSQRLTEKQYVPCGASTTKLLNNSANIISEKFSETPTFSEQFPPNQQSYTARSYDNIINDVARCKIAEPFMNESLMQQNTTENDSSTVIDLSVRSKPVSGGVGTSDLAAQHTIDLCTPIIKYDKTVVKANSQANPKRNAQRKIETKIAKVAGDNKKSPQRNTATSKRSRTTRPASDANKNRQLRSSTSNRTSAKQRKPKNNIQSDLTYLFPPKPLRYYDNTNTNNEYSASLSNLDGLPAFYPPHFVHQRCISEFTLPKVEHFNSVYRDGPSLPRHMDMQENYHTPNFLQCYNFDTESTSTPSLPDSLRGVFDTDDIREILRIEKVAYRLMEHHVRALAFVLGLSEEYLRYVLDNIQKLSPTVVEKIVLSLETAPITTPHTGLPNAEEETSIISGSPNADPTRYFPSQRRTQ